MLPARARAIRAETAAGRLEKPAAGSPTRILAPAWMDALPRPEELDQPAVKAYFERLLRAYLETPAGRASTRVPSITELLDFAEAHPELAEAAAGGDSAALATPPPPPPPASAELIPKESFVVKTREEGSERKVFVNVCSTICAPRRQLFRRPGLQRLQHVSLLTQQPSIAKRNRAHPPRVQAQRAALGGAVLRQGAQQRRVSRSHSL